MKGDKVAEYGLTALVVGGAAAVATKVGLFKYLWKLLLVGWKLVVAALAGLGAALKRLFTRGKKTPDPVPGPDPIPRSSSHDRRSRVSHCAAGALPDRVRREGPGGCHGFSGWFARAIQGRITRLLAGNGSWGWALSNPLRPDMASFVCGPPPACLTASGILLPPQGKTDWRFCSFEELGDTRVEFASARGKGYLSPAPEYLAQVGAAGPRQMGD